VRGAIVEPLARLVRKRRRVPHHLQAAMCAGAAWAGGSTATTPCVVAAATSIGTVRLECEPSYVHVRYRRQGACEREVHTA
jgi:hypothetical protein